MTDLSTPERCLSGVAARVARSAELGPTVSFELYPPRSPAAGDTLRDTIARLADVGPEFFSVTYGASGSSRHTSRAVVQWILGHVDPSIAVVAHLTCLGSPLDEVREVAAALVADGVRDFLALRGDPPSGVPDWRPEPGGLERACDLVSLLRDLEATSGSGPLSIAVAASPVAVSRAEPRTGAPVDPGAAGLCGDLQALLAKQEAGADYAITQVFFQVEDYRRYVEAARDAGVTLPLLPGIAPLADPRRLRRLEEVSGVRVPPAVLDRLDAETDEDRRRSAGTAMGVDLVDQVLAAGAPGLHLYTFNQYRAALDLLEAANLPIERAP